MKGSGKYLLWGALLTGAFFGIRYVRRQIRKYNDSIFEYTGIKAINLNPFKGDFHIILLFRYVNKMNLNFYVKNQHYDVYVNGRLVKTIDQPEDIRIPATSDTQIPIHIQFTLKEALKAGLPNLEGLFRDKSKLKIHVLGYLTIGGRLFEIKQFPVDYEDTLKNMIGE